jgi:hypothetical protein
VRLPEDQDDPAIRGLRVQLRVDLEDMDWVGDVLEPDSSAVAVVQPAQAAGETRSGLADDHLAARRAPTQTGGDVQRGAAEAPVLELDRLARVDPDADPQRNVELGRGLMELLLEVDRGADRLTRGAEDHERLVAADLDELAVVRLDIVVHDRLEAGGQVRGRLVAALLGVPRVAADVRD